MIALVVATLAVYARVAGHDFVEFDDPGYVRDNPLVQAGLTWEGVRWALTTGAMTNYWNPLVWLSHMLDTNLFGMSPGPRLLENVALHATSACLLLWTLVRTTGLLWESAFVAAAFALHPLHVESVAWLSERKDTLSTVLWMLALVAYVRWVETQRPGWALAVALSFFVGLAAKPMLVTLPFVLLLLDYWPLGRWQARGAGGLPVPPMSIVLEKLPLVAGSLLIAIVTMRMQTEPARVVATPFPLPVQLANAICAAAAYLVDTVVPAGLAMLYPMAAPSVTATAGAGLLLVAITALVVLFGGRHPALWVGWLWYCGTLLPVSGAFQIGLQARADRFTYVPLIGVFLMCAFPIGTLVRSRAELRRPVALAAIVVLTVWSGLSWAQVGLWRDSRTLFEHTLAVTENNCVVKNNLGQVLEREEHTTEAAGYYEAALRDCDHYADPHIGLGTLASREGRLDDAVAHLDAALRIQPRSSAALNDLGLVRLLQGHADEAVGLFASSRAARWYGTRAHLNLGRALLELGRPADATPPLAEAVRQEPGLGEARALLGIALARQGRFEEAVREYDRVLASDPERGATRANLAYALAQLGRLDAAIAQWTEALRLDPSNAEAHNNLGVALSMQGRREEALAHLSEAARLSPEYEEARRNLAAANESH